MAREVNLDPQRYGIAPGYVFKKWGTQRALGVLDWIAVNYGAEVVETVANLVRGFLVGEVDARTAGSSLGGLLRAHGSAGSYDAFLSMASCDASSGLWRKGGPVWSDNPGIQSALVEKGLDPDNFYVEDPLEVFRLMLAMLAESFRPFGSAWGFAAPLFGLATKAAPTSAQARPPGSQT